ncbi:MAG: hypothetical protein ACI9G1_003719 [Pirellulaceae bacterium]
MCRGPPLARQSRLAIVDRGHRLLLVNDGLNARVDRVFRDHQMRYRMDEEDGLTGPLPVTLP